jgi:hypothetical protein
MNNKLQTEIRPQVKSHKMMKLVLGIIFDLIGMSSYILEPASEFLDLAWAPISGFLLTKMYKGNVGKIAGAIDFIEELMPGTDIIPTFTLTWIYVYVIKKEV